MNEVCTVEMSLVCRGNCIVGVYSFMNQSFSLFFLSHPVQSHPVLSGQRSLGLHFHLECTYISLEYYEYQPAKEHIQRAQQLCGLNINMTGGWREREGGGRGREDGGREEGG